MTICGEADHPLLPAFRKYYSKFVDEVIIQYGVVELWNQANGDTAWIGNVYKEKVDQQNAALARVSKDTDYIICFDVDEFMSEKDMHLIIETLKFKIVDVVLFQMNQFWHSEGYVGIGGEGWAFDAWSPRIFKYTPGMTFTSHRPPTLSVPCPNVWNYPGKGNHYSYVYPEAIKRKLRYYNLIYPQFDYMKWYNEVWDKWTPETREQIEAEFSVHPSCAGAKTELFLGKHEIEWQI